LEWCKVRAREYLQRGEPADAVASMLSDLRKHEDFVGIADNLGPLGLLAATSTHEAKRFIEGFR
jgi:hypothetical protein